MPPDGFRRRREASYSNSTSIRYNHTLKIITHVNTQVQYVIDYSIRGLNQVLKLYIKFYIYLSVLYCIDLVLQCILLRLDAILHQLIASTWCYIASTRCYIASTNRCYIASTRCYSVYYFDSVLYYIDLSHRLGATYVYCIDSVLCCINLSVLYCTTVNSRRCRIIFVTDGVPYGRLCVCVCVCVCVCSPEAINYIHMILNLYNQ